MAVRAGLTSVHQSGLSCVDVVELPQDQWISLEKMRLEALGDAPEAFVTTVEAVAGQLPTFWEAQFDHATWVVARDAGETVGIAALTEPCAEAPLDCRFVESVWVEPGHRGRGVLRKIMEHLERRAADDDTSELRLWVLDSNESAGLAYEKLGFRPIPDREQDTTKCGADGTPVKERLMSKTIRPRP